MSSPSSGGATLRSSAAIRGDRTALSSSGKGGASASLMAAGNGRGTAAEGQRTKTMIVCNAQAIAGFVLAELALILATERT
jgi:hypothetical protein